MIWLKLAVVALICLGPLVWTVLRPGRARMRREAALALYRAQRAELDRDLADSRIGAAEHAAATMEIERRALAEAAITETPRQGRRWIVPALMGLVPLVALPLYLYSNAVPGLPAQPLAMRQVAMQRDAAHAAQLEAKLKAKIATLDPHSELARRGYILLGNLQDSEGDLNAAAGAWAQALAIRFDPTLAAEVAEARSRLEGRVSAQSAALFRAALAQAPPDAPWRLDAEQRLASFDKPGAPAAGATVGPRARTTPNPGPNPGPNLGPGVAPGGAPGAAPGGAPRGAPGSAAGPTR